MIAQPWSRNQIGQYRTYPEPVAFACLVLDHLQVFAVEAAAIAIEDTDRTSTADIITDLGNVVDIDLRDAGLN